MGICGERPRGARRVSYLHTLPAAQRKSAFRPPAGAACVCGRAAQRWRQTVTTDAIKDALKQVKYPGFSRDIVSFGLVRSAAVVDGTAKVSLALTTSDPTVPAALKAEVEKVLRALPGVRETLIDIAVAPVRVPAPAAAGATGGSGMPRGIKHAVAVASGKGGVGKTTFAVNLACALAQVLAAQGQAGRVGLLDCDIYGPSVPLMIGLHGRPEIEGDGADAMLRPLENHGVKVMSMGFLVDDDTPVIWRGPMIMKTVQQFVQNVDWGELEVLLVDLPPGTGDAQLSLVQTLPLDGAVLVTTPQLAATNVARKGGLMFRKVNVPLLGVAENMSYFLDPAGNRHHLFGEGGGARTAEALGTELLGQVPLLPEIRAGGDSGQPVVVTQPDGVAAKTFRTIAQSLLDRWSAPGR
jgi:ATP-binding protein involved in chromosome partitioning